MKYNITFDKNKYIQSMSFDENGQFEIDDNFDFAFSSCYQLVNNDLVLDNNKIREIEKQIENDNLLVQYHQELNNTDFIIIKSIEYQLNGLDIPYDLKSVHKQRQELRDKINELEK